MEEALILSLLITDLLHPLGLHEEARAPAQHCTRTWGLFIFIFSPSTPLHLGLEREILGLRV